MPRWPNSPKAAQRERLNRKLLKRTRNARVTEAPYDDTQPPRIFGYRRCSHPDSEESGLGLDEQLRRLTAYTQLLLVNRPGLEIAAVHEDYDDMSISAWKTPFCERPGAVALLSTAQRGDHIVVAEMSRAFRNVRDSLDTIDYLKNRDITLHFADLNIDLSSASGWLIYTVLNTVNEWHSRQLSERVKAVFANRRRLGQYVAGHPPAGWKISGARGHKVLIPDLATRHITSKIYDWREDGRSWNEITDLVEKYLAGEKGREPYRRTDDRRTWGPYRCRTAYTTEQQIRQNELQIRLQKAKGNGKADPSPTKPDSDR